MGYPVAVKPLYACHVFGKSLEILNPGLAQVRLGHPREQADAHERIERGDGRQEEGDGDSTWVGQS